MNNSMSEQNKAIARRHLEAFAANDQATLMAVYAPDFVFYYEPGSPIDRQTRLQGIDIFSATFTDLQFTIEDQIAEGDMVATRFTWRGTHTGDLQGNPPTGEQVAISAMDIARIEDGRIVEYWFNHDELGLLHQLGLVP